MTATRSRRTPRQWRVALAACLVAVAAALLAAPAARAPANPRYPGASAAPRPVYAVLRATQPVTIDGVLDEAVWSRLQPVGPFVVHDGSAAAALPTEAKLCWDDAYLYVAFSCADRDLRASYTRHDDPVCRDDAVEVFLNPTNDLVNYYEFEVNPRNVVWDGKDHNPDGLPNENVTYDERWNCAGLRTAVRMAGTLNDPADTDREWTVEMAIPFACLGRKAPRAGERWRANLYRIERGPRDEYDAWSPPQVPGASPAFHVPSRFGRFIFSTREAR